MKILWLCFSILLTHLHLFLWQCGEVRLLNQGLGCPASMEKSSFNPDYGFNPYHCPNVCWQGWERDWEKGMPLSYAKIWRGRSKNQHSWSWACGLQRAKAHDFPNSPCFQHRNSSSHLNSFIWPPAPPLLLPSLHAVRHCPWRCSSREIWQLPCHTTCDIFIWNVPIKV